MASLAFRGARKDFGSVRALAELDLEVADGEFLVLVGPSGSGKTTALRLAAGLERVSAGHIYIGGRNVTRLAPAERNVSMVFQSYALLPHLNVADNVGIGLSVRHVPKTRAAEQVRAAANLVGCEHLLNRKPFELSGGERQRVALARAMVREPDVFLLDEPLSNLDAQLRVHMRAELQRLHQRLRATMLYVTHDQVEALTMGDRVAVLRDGVLQQVAPPDQIYWQPANRFVATFVGNPAMNLVPAAARKGHIRAGPFRFRVDPVPDQLNGHLQLGIRPEHLRVHKLKGRGMLAQVQVVELVGNETFLHLSAGGRPLVARVGSDFRPDVGSRVKISIPPERVYLFDADSGRTLAYPP